jgi:IS30 family transposase
MVPVTICGKAQQMYNKTNRLTLSDRISIEAGLYAGRTLKQIALEIYKHPTTVSRELRNNRTHVPGEKPFGKDCRHAAECKRTALCGIPNCKARCARCFKFNCRSSCGNYDNSTCAKLEKPPYVCNTCQTRRKCRAARAYYSAKQADAANHRRNSEARKGIRTKGESLERLDDIVSKLILKGQPLTHIYAEHADELPVTERTLYNYIDAGVLSIGNLDLRRKLGYRPRKKKYQKSEAFDNLDFRSGRKYDDFQQYLKLHKGLSVVEMDTVRGIREQGKRLLTMIFCDTNLMLMFLMRDGKAETVVEIFDYLTSLIGIDSFRKLFPVILTDNGSEFKRVKDLESTVDGIPRTKIFYCDPQASWQKPHIEKNHEYIRYVLPRGKTLNPYTQDDMVTLMNHINSTKRNKFGGASPFELVNDEELRSLLELLGLYQIPPDEVSLSPKLLR